MKKKAFAILALWLGASAFAQGIEAGAAPQASADAEAHARRVVRVRSHLEFLASDALNGRAAGSAYARQAADYVEAEFEGIGLKTEVQDFGGKYRNVIATIPSDGEQAIVIGAHYDHLGKWLGSVYNGADDNASGVAALIEVGRILAARKLRYELILVAFDGEEIGLLGSKEYARAYSGKPIALMLSLDMVGHLRDEARLLYEGTASVRGGEELVRGVRVEGVSAKCNPEAADSGVMTDTYYFSTRKIPAFNVTTYLTESKYHTPEDDVATLDVEGVASVAEHVAAVVGRAQDGIEPTGKPLYGSGKPRIGLSLYSFFGFLGDVSVGGRWTRGFGADLNGALPAGFVFGLGKVSAIGGLQYENRSALGASGLSAADCLSPFGGVESSTRVAGLESDLRLGAYYRLSIDQGGGALHHGLGAFVGCEFLAYETIAPLNLVSMFFESRFGLTDLGPGGLAASVADDSVSLGCRLRF